MIRPIIIFGATGDLMSIKIIPALYIAFLENKLNNNIIIGVGRKYNNRREFIDFVKSSIKNKIKDEVVDERFFEIFDYKYGDLLSDDLYNNLSKMIIENNYDRPLYYFSVAFSLYDNICNKLLENKSILLNGSSVIVEKPLGSNGIEARRTLNIIENTFSKERTFFIEHYLAKAPVMYMWDIINETHLLREILNNNKLKRIDVVLWENIDIKSRGIFYEQVGCLRDVGQNHVLHLLSIASAIASSKELFIDKKLEAFQSFVPLLNKDKCLRAQYNGYRQTENVNPLSNVETAFHIELKSSMELLKNTQIYISAGKALIDKNSKYIRYWCEDHYIYNDKEILYITYHIEPRDGELIITYKNGEEQIISPAIIDNNKIQYVGEYYKIIENALANDHNVFANKEEVYAGWDVVDKCIEYWQTNVNANVNDSQLLTYDKYQNPFNAFYNKQI